ncbi:MAG: outer membrane beta-barrel protein [Bacteroidaceae bacterium]|nr:outer membrane beta-barrel protein [Bacteroidaceae bacterium]
MSKKKAIWIVLLFCMSIGMQAQVYISGGGQTNRRQTVGEQIWLNISGRILGTDEMEPKPYPLPSANIQFVCLNDTTVKEVAVTNKDGHFFRGMNVLKKRVKKNDVPRVRMKVSYVGYETYTQDLKLAYRYYDEDNKSYGGGWELNLDSIVLKSKPMSMDEVVIVGELKRMYESGDTTVFNVDAFEMPRGTVLLNLVRRMPGLRYEDGQLTYRDSVIHEIRLNGESFFAHDMKIALENIENADLKQFRVYKTQADTLSTDTTKHLVADMITKKPVNKVEMTKPEIGTTTVKNTYHFQMQGMQWKKGNKGEWNANVRLDDLPNASSKKNSNNSIDGSFRRKFGKTNVQYRPQYSYTDRRSDQESLSSTIMPEYEQYSTSASQSKNYDSNTSHNFNISTPLKAGSLNANVNYSYSDSKSHSQSSSATYNGNPFVGENNELMDEEQLAGITLNRRSSESSSRSHQQTVNMQSNFYQYFEGDANAHMEVRMNLNTNSRFQSSTEQQQTDYVQYGDSVWRYLRENIAPTNSERLGLTARGGFDFGPEKLRQALTFTYEFTHNNSESERVYYDLTNNHQRLDSISTYQQTKTDAHNISIDYRLNFKRFGFSQNIRIAPTRDTYHYERKDGVMADTTQQAPLLNTNTNLSFRISQNHYVSLSYQYSNRLIPGSNLVEPTTNNNPLYIRIANPNLKKPENHYFYLNTNWGGGWSLNADYSFSRNNISNRSIYDPKTGGTISTPENINGDWRLGGNASYRTDFKHANISVNGGYNYNHSVSYMQALGATESGKGYSNIHTISLTPQFVLYTKHFDLTLNGSYRYQWGESNYMTSDEKSHTYSLNSTWNYWLGNRLTLKTDLNISGQEGSKMRDGNRTDFIWNLGVEYKVLRDYRGLLKLTWNDILQERSNFSSYITATGRSESRSSGNPHYVLLTFQYKLYKMK